MVRNFTAGKTHDEFYPARMCISWRAIAALSPLSRRIGGVISRNRGKNGRVSGTRVRGLSLSTNPRPVGFECASLGYSRPPPRSRRK